MPSFEIKVAVVGDVNSGKSTVINALLRDKYSEVAISRRTVGVNYFRVHTKQHATATEPPTTNSSASQERYGCVTKVDSHTTFHSAEETLREISHDNASRHNAKQIKERYFDIQLSESLCDMRDDTKLVLIDIPGLNEPESRSMYLEYIEKKWDTFDCVVVVVDVYCGVDTQTLVELLHMIKQHTQEKRKVPVIILCNKVDDFEDEEVMNLADKVRMTINDVLQCTSPLSFLRSTRGDSNQMLRGMAMTTTCEALMAISAENAFNYRAAQNLSLDEVGQLDTSIINKIGHNEVPRSTWRSMTSTQRCSAVYAAVSNESHCRQCLEATNFQVFVEALNICVGGSDNQLSIIHKQQAIALRKMNFENLVANELRKLYDFNSILKPAQTPDIYTQFFWDVYDTCASQLISNFKSEMDHTCLQNIMRQLIAYLKFIENIGGGQAEKDKVIRRMVSLISLQIYVVIQASNLKSWKEEGSLVNMLLFDWDDTKKAWRFVPSSCSYVWNDENKEWRNMAYDKYSCNGNPNCLYNDHFRGPQTRDELRQGQTDAVWRRSERCGSFMQNYLKGDIEGIIRNDYTKPPRDCPHHWERRGSGWYNKYTNEFKLVQHNPVVGKLSWQRLSPWDFRTISKSILLLTHSKTFCEYFGREKSLLEDIVDEYTSLIDPTIERKPNSRLLHDVLSTFLQGTYNDQGEFIPFYPGLYKYVAQVQIPRHLSDPNHWGHLTWLFCEFMDSRTAGV